MSIEQRINYQLNKFPLVKRVIKRAYQPRLLHGPFRHGGRAFRIHGPSRMGQQNAERYRKALLAQRHPPVGRRHGHPRHARHGRRQNGLRRTPVRAALRLHRRWSRRLDITAYGPFSGHKYATRPERRRAGRAVLEVGVLTSFFLIAILLSNR